jgi:hypothetical protein
MRIIDKIATGSLILLGLASVVISALDFFLKGFESIPIFKDTPQIILLLVGVLCFAIGLERFTKFEDINRRLNDLFKQIGDIAPAQVLDGHEAIYDAAIELINDAKKVIRASSFREKHCIAPKRYLQSLISKVQKCKKQHQTIEYRLLYGYSNLDDLINTDTQHKALFASHGIGDCFRYAYLNSSIGIDLLIVDNTNLLIALPTLSTDPDLRKGIKFVNHPELVGDICSWFDNYLWNKANISITLN